MGYLTRNHFGKYHELELSKLTPQVLDDLAKQGMTVTIDSNFGYTRAYVHNPTKSQLEYLAKRELLRGVCVIYDLDEQTYKVIPKPAAILCELAGTCKIIKTFKHSTEAWKYLERLRK